jgi:hypothetical protein
MEHMCVGRESPTVNPPTTPGTCGISPILVGLFFTRSHAREFFGKIKFTAEVLLAA